MKKTIATAALLLAGPMAFAEPAAVDARALQTLEAMKTTPDMGGKVEWDVRTMPISVKFAPMKELWTEDSSAKPAVITVNEELAGSDLAVGAALAGAHFRIKYADMPDCAEKRYMEASSIARVYIELGGSVDGLPVTDPKTGYQNAELEKTIRYWVETKPADIAKSLPGAPTLAQLAAKSEDDVKQLAAHEDEWSAIVKKGEDMNAPEAVLVFLPEYLDAYSGIERLADARRHQAELGKSRKDIDDFLADENMWDHVLPFHR